MQFLLLSIISSTIILLVFKYIERLKIAIFYPIVINYITAATLGLLLDNSDARILELPQQEWFISAIIIGILLIIMFYIIGIATQKVGIAVTTISGRMSMVMPIVFSIIVYNESIGPVKIIGIIIAITAVFFALVKKNNASTAPSQISKGMQILIPLLLFFGMGSIDTLIKYNQAEYVNADYSSYFTAILFAFSGIIGIVISFFRIKKLGEFIKPVNIGTGILLGSANFGSIYFFLLALNTNVLESSIVFSVNNIGIVLLSVLSAMLFFKEKLSKLNRIGVILSVIAILLLAFHDKIML